MWGKRELPSVKAWGERELRRETQPGQCGGEKGSDMRRPSQRAVAECEQAEPYGPWGAWNLLWCGGKPVNGFEWEIIMSWFMFNKIRQTASWRPDSKSGNSGQWGGNCLVRPDAPGACLGPQQCQTRDVLRGQSQQPVMDDMWWEYVCVRAGKGRDRRGWLQSQL